MIVLLVEDDPGDVIMITEALHRTGPARVVHVVADGQEALEFLHRADRHSGAPTPDLILLDLNMPRVDGRQALAQIKADETLRRIPVVVFTSSSTADDIVVSYQRHANAYVAKPIDLDDFDRVVGQIDQFFTGVAQRVHSGTLSRW